jgi:sulfate adenylyltransferase subunit 1
MGRLLVLSTAGSVDDGKSTLLGRLVHDAQGLLTDNAAAIRVGEKTDFSRLTDGLVAEREQGITIDVAWKHLQIADRRYLLADAPGHEQYTRNLVTAASHADALIILVDPTRLDLSGIAPPLLTQTVRHSAIAHLLRIPHVTFVVNKLDLFSNSHEVFEKVKRSLNLLVREIGLDRTCRDIAFIAASALTGENIAVRGVKLNWFSGPTLLDWLETVATELEQDLGDETLAILPIQTSLRTQGDAISPFRGVAGRLAQGALRPGDEVTVLPSQASCRIRRLLRHGQEVSSAQAGQSVTVVLDRDLDISRGDWIFSRSAKGSDKAPNKGPDEGTSDLPVMSDRIQARLTWLSETPGALGGRLVLKIGSREIPARIQESIRQFDTETLNFPVEPPDNQAVVFHLNEIHDVWIHLAEPAPFQAADQRLNTLTRFVLMTPGTWTTVAAGIVLACEGPLR